jgi:hypothetical protein
VLWERVSGLANMESAGKEVLTGKEGLDSRLRGNDTRDCNTLASNGTVPRVLHLPGKVDLAISIPEIATRLDSRMRGNDESQREGRIKGVGWNPGSLYQLPMSRSTQTIEDFLDRCTYYGSQRRRCHH